MKASLIILIVVFGLSCGVTKDAAKITDQEALQGVWLAETESQNGIKKNVSYQYVFERDTLTFTDETGKEVKYTYKLDTTSSLKFIVVQPDETLNITAPVSIAYELSGDSLKIVIAPAGLRPTAISDENNQELVICKRKRS